MKTKGATSFVTVTLQELNGVLREEALVVISRKYAETLSLKGRAFEASKEKHEDFGCQVEIKSEELGA